MKFFGKGKKAQPPAQVTPADTGQGPMPDYQRMMRVMAGDAKGHALGKLLKSDADNAVKANIHNVFNMSVMDVLGSWESCESEEDIIRVFLNGRTSISDATEIEGGYRINSMAEDFKMTLGYIEAFKAWTLIGGQGQASAPSTLKEGDKK